MFKIAANPTFKAKVKVTPADGDPFEFGCVFKHKRKSEADALIVEIDGGRKPEDWISEVLVSWDIPGVDYTPENLIELVENHISAPKSFLHGYLSGLFGAQRGN